MADQLAEDHKFRFIRRFFCFWPYPAAGAFAVNGGAFARHVFGDTSIPEKSDSPGSPLFVDLDGTLLRTDLLWETLLKVVKDRPKFLWRLTTQLRHGRAVVKRVLAEAVKIDPQNQPYHDEVLRFLEAERQRGRTIILATASDHVWAEQIAAHLELFDEVIASDGQLNCKGAAKLERIEACCSERDAASFGYVGDSAADLPIWNRASEIIAVEPTPSLYRKLTTFPGTLQIIGSRPPLLASAWRAMRPQHWVKNALLFAPCVLAHQIGDLDRVSGVVFAFIAFCACASAVYVINDLFDVSADRTHHDKRHRPFASGQIPLVWGPVIAAVLLLIAFAIALLAVRWPFAVTLGVYLLMTTAYSVWLKSRLLIDVLVLAGLYALRVLAGGVAADVPVSQWLLAFSGFLFISLAFLKRYAELSNLSSAGSSEAPGRGYQVTDLSLIESIGITSGLLAVLVFAMYINGDPVKQLYGISWPLWLICPLLLYWICRLWFLAKRGSLTEDPVVFAVRDPVSWIVGTAVGLLMFLATAVELDDSVDVSRVDPLTSRSGSISQSFDTPDEGSLTEPPGSENRFGWAETGTQETFQHALHRPETERLGESVRRVLPDHVSPHA